MKKPLTWIPWYVDSWIYGSSRIELTRAQRSDFLDLVLLAGKDDGFIRANATMAYPPGQLAGMLSIEPEDLEETIKRCIEVGKIKRFENGILYVTNWETYKLTARWRQKLEKRGPLSDSPPKEDIEKSRGEESKGKANTVRKKANSSPPTPGKQDMELDQDGLLPIPKGLPFEAQDELKKRRAELRRLARMIEAGYKHDGPAQLTPEILEQHKKAFNDRVADFS